MTENNIQPSSIHAASKAAADFVEKQVAESEAGAPGPEVEDAPNGAEVSAQGGTGGQEETSAPTEDPTPEETVRVSMGDGKEVEMTQSELLRNARLGLLAGDEDFIDAARSMDAFVEQHPEAKAALEAVIRNPEIAGDVVGRFAATEQQVEASSDPQANKIAELSSQVAALQAQVAGEKQATPEEQFRLNVAERVKGYPALQSLPQEVLVDAIQSRVSRGENITNAIASLASQTAGKQATDASALASKAHAARNLQGLGDAKGSAATSVVPPKKLSGDDLNEGNVMRAALSHLRASR